MSSKASDKSTNIPQFYSKGIAASPLPVFKTNKFTSRRRNFTEAGGKYQANSFLKLDIQTRFELKVLNNVSTLISSAPKFLQIFPGKYTLPKLHQKPARSEVCSYLLFIDYQTCLNHRSAVLPGNDL